MVNINDSLAVKPKSKRIFYFDALRAMAIIAVIVIHVFLDNGSQTAVCGATEADALANYQLYLDTRGN